ncbi:MAG: hypothetical protein [Inoviridae sp.]|nr:MAG: hypothetical protein [Inoviridae sp.]
MVLYIAALGSKNPAQNRLDFEDVDRVEINYVRSGNTYYYQYVKNHYDSFQVSYSSDVFLYTNVVDGYARFHRTAFSPLVWILLLAAAVAVVSLFLKGGGKR